MEGNTASRWAPNYQSHKKVFAAKINAVDIESDGSAVLMLDGYDKWRVGADYVRKHNPRAGGYYVQYKDGYQSWSPAEAFEEGYTLIT